MGMTEGGAGMTEGIRRGRRCEGLILLCLGGGNRDCRAPINRCSQ